MRSNSDSSDDLAVVPWYTTSDQYLAFRRCALDAEDFFTSFDQWKVVAMEHERQAAEQGVIIIRIRMFLDPFLQWCAANGSQNDAPGRTLYAEDRAKSILGS